MTRLRTMVAFLLLVITLVGCQQPQAAQTLTGGLLGLAVAVVLGWLIFAAGKQLNVGTFFRSTSVLLILFAAGLFAHGVHELQEAGLIPVIVEHAYDINAILDEGGTVRTFLKALLGYNGNPSLLEMFSYVAYFGVIGILTWKGWKALPGTVTRQAAA